MRSGRQGGTGKILIVDQNNVPFVQNLNGLSSGQSTLFSIFSTILRYADAQNRPSSAIEGIVLIDEADAHLHADMQHDVLPQLMQLFPRVQFIVSSHAPLFPLGMKKLYGADGFTLLELPAGLKIDAERLKEFERSIDFYQDTKLFEKRITDLASSANKPLILCEGEMDRIYLKTAAELLGLNALVESVTFDWVGQKLQGSSQGGGKENLDAAGRFLRHNPNFLAMPTMLVYNSDAGKTAESFQKLFVRGLPANPDNQVCKAGIENLLPTQVFEKRFYDLYEKITANITIIRSLKKNDLCQWLCTEVRNPNHFEKFRVPLEEIMNTLLPASAA